MGRPHTVLDELAERIAEAASDLSDIKSADDVTPRHLASMCWALGLRPIIEISPAEQIEWADPVC